MLNPTISLHPAAPTVSEAIAAPREASTQDTAWPVAVLGAGPVGLAAAAHPLECGLTPSLLEAGNGAGANLMDYGHVRLFSPWRYTIDPSMARLLEPTG